MMHRIRSLILRSALLHAPTALACRKLCVMLQQLMSEIDEHPRSTCSSKGISGSCFRGCMI
jgi:hypothetical protein